MIKGKLTREELVAVIGEELVKKLESENCEPTCRCGFNGPNFEDDFTEWRASIKIDHPDYEFAFAYYYTTNDQDNHMGACDGDGSSIDWEINGYELL